jgi:hypothetical protein
LQPGETFVQVLQLEHGNGNHFDDLEDNFDLSCPGFHSELTAYDLRVGIGHPSSNLPHPREWVIGLFPLQHFFPHSCLACLSNIAFFVDASLRCMLREYMM